MDGAEKEESMDKEFMRLEKDANNHISNINSRNEEMKMRHRIREKNAEEDKVDFIHIR